MSRGINKVILIGNLGRDPEVTYTQGGLAIAKFSLATTESRKDASGEWKDETQWHRIVLFGKTAETAGQYLAKGQPVYIEGRLSYGSYEKEGVKHYTTDIIGQVMRLLGRRGEGAQGGGGDFPPADSGPPPKSAPDAADGDIDDDLPF
ncbi:MAG: hypothetical protein A2139_14630 [Desulfobacca sp. RBG_16_60_12]|nr:MAG: hypothetical protein A2139_14630 [Desulfobacca sp. RBG_16_60_12]